ncbi:Transmembrane protein 138 family protein [Acanthocheilonema viteae]
MANKYGVLLLIQIGMISLDLTFNILDSLIATDSTVQLMLHLLQDALIVLSIIIILIAFSSTFVFQAGLIVLLLSKFASTIILSLTYLALSILLHFYDMRQRWFVADQSKWSTVFFTLYILQRIAATLYYFTYKRTILLLSNPKYHHDSEWIREQIRQKN